MFRAIPALLLAALFSGAVMAHGCPGLMEEIDEALDGNVDSHYQPETINRAENLREEGEKHHAEGDHDRAMEKLEEAKKELGL